MNERCPPSDDPLARFRDPGPAPDWREACRARIETAIAALRRIEADPNLNLSLKPEDEQRATALLDRAREKGDRIEGMVRKELASVGHSRTTRAYQTLGALEQIEVHTARRLAGIEAFLDGTIPRIPTRADRQAADLEQAVEEYNHWNPRRKLKTPTRGTA